MALPEKQDPVFDLIRNMTKAEKRNFKLYATRLSGNQDAKFLMLFDCLDSIEEYDESRILSRCPVKKEQLPNMKAHLYKQLLTSIRLLNVRHSDIMQLREQLDFAHILFDKGLYRQSSRILDKVEEQADELEQYAINLDIVNFQSKLETMNVTKDMISESDKSNKRVASICDMIENNSELSNTTTKIYSLYQQLGYARTQKDLDLIRLYFYPRLEAYAGRERKMSFHERFYFYQASAWYYYIQHDFVKSYRYSRLWVGLFEANPRMKKIMYDDYLRGFSQILEGLYLMRKYRHFVESFGYFEREFEEIKGLNNNAYFVGQRIQYTNRIHKCFIEGEFKEGLKLVGDIEDFIGRYSEHLGVHSRMLLYYKTACLYFGDDNYEKCMEYLARITSTKDPQIRRDLQCFARILNLIASYESGLDYSLDYQIRSVYSFLVKMNDMHSVQKEMLGFLKKLNGIYAEDLKSELEILYERLRPYENHPYERRTFYYLDILSWLESKITGRSVCNVIRDKFFRLRNK